MIASIKLISLLTAFYLLSIFQSYSQCTSGQTSVDLSIDFIQDNYPDEDGWQLFNISKGILIDSACFGTYTGSSTLLKNFCLTVGDTFKLMVLDDYGDGLDGAVYSLDYTYGSNIGIVDTSNLNIPYTHCGGKYTSNSIADSIVFTTLYFAPPPCQLPTNLYATDLQPYSVELGWTENDTATEWQIEYGNASFTKGTGTLRLLNSKPFKISALNPSTNYEFYVRSICAAGDSSAWAGPFEFTTACAPISSFPYFEGYNTGLHCWRTSITSGSESWNLINGSSGDILLANEDTGFVEKNYPESEALLISPPFDFTRINSNAQVKIWLHRHDKAFADDQYKIYVNSSPILSGADSIFSLYSKTNIAPAVSSTGWYEYIVDIPVTFNNDTSVYVIVEGITGNELFSYDLGVDAFTLEEIPSCRPPALLNAANIDNNSADLNWTERGTANIWQIEYDTANFTLGTGTNQLVASKPTNISGLSANSSYDYYVRSVCSIGDSSSWAGPFNFHTGCDAISTFPYLENFDGTLLNDVWACWKTINSDGGESWRQGNQYLSSTRSAPFAAQGMGNNDDHLISPQLNLPSDPMMLKLWDVVENQNFNNIYSILVSTSGNAAGDFTDTLATFNVTNTNWTERTVYLSDYVNQSIYISIYQSYSAADFYGFGIDNFLIDSMPSCVEPSNLFASYIGTDSVNLNWTENGLATSWEIEYGVRNFTQGQGITLASSSIPTNIGGLNASSNYSFYVRSVCSSSDSSKWAGPFHFRTNCLAFSIPYTEDFENGGSLPPCWNQGTENIDRWWFAESIFGNSHIGNNGKYTSNSLSDNFFAYVDDSPPHVSNTSLLTPFVDISTASSPLVSFFKINHNEGQGNVNFSVDLWDGGSWTQIYFSDTNSWQGEWEQVILSLDTFLLKDPIRLRFVVDEVNGNDAFDDFAIDDIFIGDAGQFTPYYTVGILNTVDANGIADSLNVQAFTTGLVAGIDLDSSAAMSFTLIDTSWGVAEGIKVKSSSSVSNYNVAKGDLIHLRGVVQQTNGLQELLVDSIKILERTISLPARQPVNMLNESTESQLIEIGDLSIDSINANEILLSDGNNTFLMLLEEESHVTDSVQFSVGDAICSIKGIGGQMDSTAPFLSAYYISPMHHSDIIFSPVVDLGADTIVCDTSNLILDAGTGFASYFWSTGENTQIIQPTAKDSLYIVSVMDSSGCTTVDSILVIIDICTSIEERELFSSIKISPNPSSGSFGISATGLGNENTTIMLRDIRGKLILSKQLNVEKGNFETRINLENRSKGIYFLSIVNGREILNRKIVVQ